jgi:hypothetical protein
LEQEDDVLLQSLEIRMWRVECLCGEWMSWSISENLAYIKMIKIYEYGLRINCKMFI